MNMAIWGKRIFLGLGLALAATGTLVGAIEIGQYSDRETVYLRGANEARQAYDLDISEASLDKAAGCVVDNAVLRVDRKMDFDQAYEAGWKEFHDCLVKN